MTEEGFSGRLASMLRAGWRFAWVLLLVAVVPLILVYVLGFSAKTTEEYACALQIAEQHQQLVAITGEPITPGLFAWITYLESGVATRQGRFSTRLTGPDGEGKLVVEFYRTPIGASFGLWFKTGGQELEIYYGDYPCH